MRVGEQRGVLSLVHIDIAGDVKSWSCWNRCRLNCLQRGQDFCRAAEALLLLDQLGESPRWLAAPDRG